MINQVLYQELFSRAQFDSMAKSLDDLLQIYTEAVLVCFIAALIAVAWLVFCEARQTKAIRKVRSNHRTLKTRHLLRSDPFASEARMNALSTAGE